jgi:hypothetical protein
VLHFDPGEGNFSFLLATGPKASQRILKMVIKILAPKPAFDIDFVPARQCSEYLYVILLAI